MTTRAAAQAFFVAGTNRAMFRFTLINHLCLDLEQVQDPTRPPDRIRQDVSRSPGGDSRVFLNNCVGCHAGMDPLAQAFAYYDYDETGGPPRVHAGPGAAEVLQQRRHVPPRLSSRPTTTGTTTGARAATRCSAGTPRCRAPGRARSRMGRELASTERFARCQVEKVFRNVCFRPPSDAADRARVDAMTSSFRANGYRLKRVFAEAATYCMGE